MPIYEYRCQQCGHQLERIQRMSDAPLVDCPACEKPQLKRLISAAAFRFKGGGWYETDFKKDNQRNIADTGNEAPKAAESTPGKSEAGDSSKPADAKSDTKVDSKTDVKKESGAGVKSETKPAAKTESKPAKSDTA